MSKNTIKHFGVIVQQSKYGFKLERSKYAEISKISSFKSRLMGLEGCYEDEEGRCYTDEWCTAHREKCLVNFDLNMKLFESLDHDVFDKEIGGFLEKHRQFQNVEDLTFFDKIPGYYMMILDEYCQIYIGTSLDIKKRIQQHWSKIKPFDRLMFPIGAVDSSVLSIDSFRALDTSRIYAYPTSNLYEKENDYINYFSSEFNSNRVGGGILLNDPSEVFKMLASIKTKRLD